MKKYIPNSITLLNLLCGAIATILAVENRLDWAAFFVVLGIFFDFFDGFFARLLNVKSAIGLQLDSLADMVTSGLVPAIVLFQMLKNSSFILENPNSFIAFIPYLGLFVVLASAYRLANFNIDTRQTEGFIGLPTPANALFILSLPLILQYQSYPVAHTLLTNTWVLLGIVATSCYLLNAEIPLFALKFKSFGFNENKIKYIFLAISILLLMTLQFVGIPLIIILYVVLSKFISIGVKN